MEYQPTGKVLFLQLCDQLAQVKLVIYKEGSESVGFGLPEEWQTKTGVTNQLATVQYVGGSKKIANNEVTGITLRLYIKPWRALGLSDRLTVLAHSVGFAEKGGGTPYYDFIFEEGLESAATKVIIYDIFQLLHRTLLETFGAGYRTMPMAEIPVDIEALPC